MGVSSAEPESFTTYTYKDAATFSTTELIDKLSPYDFYQYCHSEKLAIPGQYPLIFKSGGHKKNQAVSRYGNIKPTEFLKKVLLDKWFRTKQNGIAVDMNIQIQQGSNTLYYLTSDFTMPKCNGIEVIEEGSQYLVKLINPPKGPTNERLKFEDHQNPRIYNELCQSGTYLPHQYPKLLVRNDNLFRTPEKMEQKLLENFVGMYISLGPELFS